MTEVLDRAFDALANRHRRNIVMRLLHGPVETPVLSRDFGMSKQAMHKHLTILENADLISRERRGRVHQIRLHPEPLDEVAAWASTVHAAWADSMDRLALVLDDEGTAEGNEP